MSPCSSSARNWLILPCSATVPSGGQTVFVNILDTGTYNGQPWVGTPLADTSGYVGLIPHTVAELTVNGGTVSLQAGTAVSLDSGSAIDVAGGWSNYAGGTVQTTKLLYHGQPIDIAQATPDRVYDGIYTGTTTAMDAKWDAAPQPWTTRCRSELICRLTLRAATAGPSRSRLEPLPPPAFCSARPTPGQNQRQSFVPYSSYGASKRCGQRGHRSESLGTEQHASAQFALLDLSGTISRGGRALCKIFPVAPRHLFSGDNGAAAQRSQRAGLVNLA